MLELDSTRATFTYDATRQIISEARGGTMAYSRSYVWDPLGNRIQQYDSGVLTSGTFNKANQQTLISPATGATTTQTYDGGGNLTLANTGGALTTQIWTVENRLASYVDSKGDSLQSLYSDDGLRRQRTNASGTTNLTYDGKALLLETSASGALEVRYTNRPKTWGRLVSQNAATTSSFFGFDSQGSARILVSIAGLVTDIKSWKAFGEPVQTGSGTGTPYGYVALYLYYTEIIGVLINTWNRWPSPSRGGYPSADLIGFLGGDWNLYRYASNDPVSLYDPSGLSAPTAPDNCGNHWIDMCSYARTQGCAANPGGEQGGDPNVPDIGGSVCCDGIAWVCSWLDGHPLTHFPGENRRFTNTDRYPCLSDAILQHESCLIKGGYICPDNDHGAIIRTRVNGNLPAMECACQTAALESLLAGLNGDCCKNVGDAMTCQDYGDHLFCETIYQLKLNCGGGGQVPPQFRFEVVRRCLDYPGILP